MHTIKLKVKDSIYSHIIYLLKSLNQKEVEIIEDSKMDDTVIKINTEDEKQISHKNSFIGLWNNREEMRNSSEWVRNIRDNEWG